MRTQNDVHRFLMVVVGRVTALTSSIKTCETLVSLGSDCNWRKTMPVVQKSSLVSLEARLSSRML